MDIEEACNETIGAAIEVHRHLGPGLLESAYETCLAHELRQRGLKVETQQALPVVYKGLRLDAGYRLDLLVEQVLVVELKSTDQLQPIHLAQVLTYLKQSGFTLGLLINFNVPLLRNGIKRVVHKHKTP